MRAQAVILAAALPLAACNTTVRRNTPIEHAEATVESTGFGRTTLSNVTTGMREQVTLLTRTGHAASVVEGPRGDRVWKLTDDGLTLLHCQFLDERPTDCVVVPLPTAAYQPTLLDPTNLGGAGFLAADSQYVVTSGGTRRPGKLRATPHFGVWVSSVPRLVIPTLYGGNVVLGGAISFCHVHQEKGPRCVDTGALSSEVMGVFVLRSGDKTKHVIWSQPVGTNVLARCEADDETGEVTCKNTKETSS